MWYVTPTDQNSHYRTTLKTFDHQFQNSILSSALWPSQLYGSAKHGIKPIRNLEVSKLVMGQFLTHIFKIV